MWMGYRKTGIGLLAGLMFSGVLAAVAFAKPPESPPASSDATQSSPPATQAEATPVMDWWLGVQCRPMNDALRRDLGLTETGGVLVEKTVPESPAEKAGLQKHDVLITAGDKPLQNARDLLEAVNASEGKELVVEYLRDGQKHQVSVRPQRRPDWARVASSAEQAALRKWLEQLQSGEPGAPMRFRFIHPGTILPQGAPAHPPLPPNVSITIVKRGSELAKVIVTRNDQKWEVAENELDKLPKDLAPYAEYMLGRTLWGPSGGARLFEFVPDGAGRFPTGGDETAPSASEDPKAEPGSPLERRMEEMNQQIEQLRRSIEELRKAEPH